MRRLSNLIFTSTLGLLAGLTGACDDETEVGVEERMCERFDECNYLEPGIAVDDCIDDRRMCTDGLVSSEYADWKEELEDCLAKSNCDNYLACWQNAPSC